MFMFRADGNSQIGAGHVMRCLSIADAVRAAGEECVFITASEDMESVIRGKNHELRILRTDYRRMEAEGIRNAVDGYEPSVIFVDSYYVTEKYLSMLKEWCENKGSRLVYIDDIKAFPYPCHELINYQIHGSAADYERLYGKSSLPELMVGTEYAPLRREFLEGGIRKIRREARDVLVTTGGADSEHLTVELMKAVDSCDLTFHFVIGSMNRDKDILHELSKKKNARLYENVTGMAKLMRSCDMAVSAAGSTLYELCATGTPAVTYVLADNQIPIAEGFAARGIMENCGDIRALGGEGLAEKLIQAAGKLADDFRERQRTSRLMKTVVDGRGAERIVNRILG